jgi:hypothetical protein
MTKKQIHYSTRQAAARIGVSFRTLNRWIAEGTLKPSEGIPLPWGVGKQGGSLWFWSDADIARGREVKATLKPGRKAKVKK